MADELTATLIPLVSNASEFSDKSIDWIVRNEPTNWSDNKIDWEDTRLMFERYRAHDKALRVLGREATPDLLRGFRIPRGQLQNIIDQGDCTGVMIMFAVRPSDVHKSMPEQYFTIVISGIDSNNNLMTDDNVYDYCDPCPRNCPDDDSGIFH